MIDHALRARLERNAQKERLRERAPDFALFVDQFRQVFGQDCRVTYLKVGNLERGKYR